MALAFAAQAAEAPSLDLAATMMLPAARCWSGGPDSPPSIPPRRGSRHSKNTVATVHGLGVPATSEPRHDLLDHIVRPSLDLLQSLILYGMRDEDGFQVGSSQAARLHPGSGAELFRGQRHGGDSGFFESNAVVQTARCAGASVSQGFDHPVYEGELLEQRSGSGLGVGRLDLPNDLRDSVPLLEQVL